MKGVSQPGALPSAPNPQAEFAATLREAGFILDGGHPIMDGHRHRVPVDGDRRGQTGGYYVGYLDGRPAGYYKNHRTGVAANWKTLGYSLNREDRSRLVAEAAAKKAARAKEQEAVYARTADSLAARLSTYRPLAEPTPYLRAKGVEPAPGAFTDERQTTILPAYDAAGRHWTTQYINPDGVKRFAKDSHKEGCFHVAGGGTPENLDSAPVIVMAEGYVTALDVRRALGGAMPVVTAFDSGNLEPVANALRQRYPNKPILVVGDDDRQLVAKLGANPGRDHATAAARAVNGHVFFPTFLSDCEGTDFNDLVRSAVGETGARRQLVPVFARLVEGLRHVVGP